MLETVTDPERIDVDRAVWARLAASLRVVEAELNTDCNRACRYCPQAVDLVPRGEVMSDGVFEALLSDLARVEFSGRFSHHLYGEPLLNPRLAERVRRVREALPRAAQVLFTNGDLLTDEKHEELLDAGVALTVVTRHQRGPYPERRRQVVQRAKELLFTSRGGAIEWLRRRRAPEELKRERVPCLAPTEMLVVTWDGRVLRCYEDARRTEDFGDLRTHTLAAIWLASTSTRDALARGDRCAAGGACSTCDNANHDRPGQSVATETFWRTHPDAREVAERISKGV